jgi:hypothetical protein
MLSELRLENVPPCGFLSFLPELQPRRLCRDWPRTLEPGSKTAAIKGALGT